MKFQKFLSAAIVTVLLALGSQSVMAQTLGVEISGKNVSVTVQNPDNKRIFSVITLNGAEVKDSNLFGICETDGEKLNFIMPDYRDGVDGEYTLYVQGKAAGNFYYAKESSRTSALEVLAVADEAKLEEMLLPESEHYYALRALGFNVDGYEALSDKEEVLNMFAKRGESKKSEAELFNEAVSASQMNNDGDSAQVLEKLNPTVGEASFNELSEELKTWIENDINANSPYENIEAFENQIELANILYQIDKAKFSQLNGLLSEYENELELDSDSYYTKYQNMSETNQTKVHDYIVAAFEKGDCTSKEILKDTLKDAVNSIGSGSGSSGGSGGGGSSSGGKSSGSAFAPVSAPTTTEKPKEIEFDDLSQAEWAKEAILALAEKGIVSGDGNGSFNPNDNVTREQFVKMIVSAMGIEVKKSKNMFDDVNKDSWYADYVLSAYNEGVVFGVSDTEFGIGSLIKRQDMAVIAYRALKSKTLEHTREAVAFADADMIKDYAKEAIEKLYMAGVVNGMGDNCFNPDSTATRAESAMIIYNLFVKE